MFIFPKTEHDCLFYSGPHCEPKDVARGVQGPHQREDRSSQGRKVK